MVTLDAITFDLDDTLWDNQGVMLKTEEGHYRWLLEALAAWRAARQEAPLPLTYDEGVADYLQRRLQQLRLGWMRNIGHWLHTH